MFNQFTSPQEWNVIVLDWNVSNSGEDFPAGDDVRPDQRVLDGRQTRIPFLKTKNETSFTFLKTKQVLHF